MISNGWLRLIEFPNDELACKKCQYWVKCPGYYMPRRLEQLGQSKFDGQQNCQDKLLSWLYNQDKTYVFFKNSLHHFCCR